MSAPKLRAPIVLVHGLLGYDRIALGGLMLADYFPGIPAFLHAAGNRVFTVRLSPTAGVAERARQLKAFLDGELPNEPVHLIGHSMGGLDARYMVSRLAMGPRVASLTTLGTPHRGSPVADWGIARMERWLRPVLDHLGIPPRAFYDLTTAACRRFNEETPDVPDVRYFSVAGRQETAHFAPAWRIIQRRLSDAEGPNDGLVSVASATHGDSVDIWEADHLDLVNWGRNMLRGPAPARDRLSDYARLLVRLSSAGF